MGSTPRKRYHRHLIFCLGLIAFGLVGCESEQTAWQSLRVKMSSLKQKKRGALCRFKGVPLGKGLTNDYNGKRCQQAPATCFDECFATDPDATGPKKAAALACYGLAIAVQQKAAKEPDAGYRDYDTIPVFEQACAHGHLSGCTNYASRLWRHDKDNETQVKCAAQLLHATCKAEDPMACLSIGGYEISLENRDKGEALLKKTCELAPKSAACQTATDVLSSYQKE